ncbi:hypothetical protein F4803DRAFT_210194 [Xylaria telfairii]|nr:hypothetical protein F4803DRAFT_210194 [Xylaria telfairii]
MHLLCVDDQIVPSCFLFPFSLFFFFFFSPPFPVHGLTSRSSSPIRPIGKYFFSPENVLQKIRYRVSRCRGRGVIAGKTLADRPADHPFSNRQAFLNVLSWGLLTLSVSPVRAHLSGMLPKLGCVVFHFSARGLFVISCRTAYLQLTVRQVSEVRSGVGWEGDVPGWLDNGDCVLHCPSTIERASSVGKT